MFELKKVNTFTMRKVPQKDENISDDIEIDEILPLINSINYYKREKEECPFGCGYWILDIMMLGNDIVCLKYPLEMTESHFMDYIKPLLDAFKQKRMH